MKKFLVILMAVVGFSLYADNDRNDMLEQNIENVIYDTLPTIQDGAVTVDIWDVSVDVKSSRTDVEIDLPNDAKVSKAALNTYAKSVADAVRKTLKNNKPVYVEIGLDESFFDSKLVRGKF